MWNVAPADRTDVVTAAHLLAFAHVLAAVLWVSGQLAMAWLRPRAVHDREETLWDITETIAYAGWAAYAALWITGAVNLITAGDALRDNAYGALALVKIAAVILSGVAARSLLSASAERVRLRANVTAAAAVVVLFLGVLLDG